MREHQLSTSYENDLKPNPADNASVVLTYHDAGLFSKLGRVWVLSLIHI